jgi:outer membrane protein OmpA-like peptidoglycan-associated protein
MKTLLTITGSAILFASLPVSGQEPAKKDTVPIFHVTVVENSVIAINYQYRQGPTKIDFRGTVLMPEAKGEATVESKRGRTEIDATLEHMLPPQRFGREYLTYTLWAITPEGGARNIAEILPGPSDKATLHVSTDLQAFGLIVTAEPYSAARQPSNVVVLENRVRPDTAGKVEQVKARYELMPRGQYTWTGPEEPGAAAANAPKVSMDRYEAILEIYEAQNALGIARAAQAEQYAPQTLAKAQQLYDEAQKLLSSKGPSKSIVQDAREAVQTAEDARMIAQRRHEDEAVAKAQAETTEAQQALARAQQETQQARADAATAQNRAERAEADALAARASGAASAPPPPPPPPVSHSPSPEVRALQPKADTRKTEMRMGLLEQLNGVIAMRDTGRGLVATVPDSAFTGPELHPNVSAQLGRLALVVQSHPGLKIEVEGNTDSGGGEGVAQQRAEAIRATLTSQGFPAAGITARGMGDTHPLGSNANAAGREANRRVEIVISGDPIGDHAFWDKPYAIAADR